MSMNYYKWVKKRDESYEDRRPADKQFLEKLGLRNIDSRSISMIKLDCISPYTRCEIELMQKYVDMTGSYTYEPKPYVFKIFSETNGKSGIYQRHGYYKSLELDVNTRTLTFGGYNDNKLEIDLSEVPEDEKEHISLPAEEISKLSTWLCSFAELRDTVVPSQRGAQVWRARKPIE